MFLRVDREDYTNIINLDNVVNIETRLVFEDKHAVTVYMVDGRKSRILTEDTETCLAIAEVLWEFIFTATQGGYSTINLSTLIDRTKEL